MHATNGVGNVFEMRNKTSNCIEDHELGLLLSLIWMFIFIIIVINVLKIFNFPIKISNAHHKKLHVMDFIYFDGRMMPGIIKKISTVMIIKLFIRDHDSPINISRTLCNPTKLFSFSQYYFFSLHLIILPSLIRLLRSLCGNFFRICFSLLLSLL